MNPLVLILSYGDRKPIKITEDLLMHTGSNKTMETTTLGSTELSTYPCYLKTKYYENTIALVPFEKDHTAITTEMLDVTEAIIVYFDSEDPTFMQEMSGLCKIVKDNDIEIGILLTNKLQDDPSTGLTYTTVKEKCKALFDVIELNGEQEEEDEGEEEQPGKPKRHEYSEVMQALRNHLWSNVQIDKKGSSNSMSDQNGPDNLEAQLEAFESLLATVKNFQRVSANMDRETVLDEAEKLAGLFANILEEDSD